MGWFQRLDHSVTSEAGRERPPLTRDTRKTIVSFRPLRIAGKIDFVNMLSDESARQGYFAREFRWIRFGLDRTDFIFLHWPDDLFIAKSAITWLRALYKLCVLKISKALWGAKLVWVAHNARPHDDGKVSLFMRRSFLRSLDGVVYLSQHSSELIRGLYPELSSCKSLITVHAHYRQAALTPETPFFNPNGDINLLQFGTIRPYKNIEGSISAVSSVPAGFRLVVAGYKQDVALARAIQEQARSSPQIRLDFRDGFLGDAELEALVDASDAVLLPYRNILNSGAALYSLSRNRPVLAPNMGSLPELRDAVGNGWVFLYDGEFTPRTLVDFREWMYTSERPLKVSLDAYGIERVGNDLRCFLESYF